jgi:hypothetical protein
MGKAIRFLVNLLREVGCGLLGCGGTEVFQREFVDKDYIWCVRGVSFEAEARMHNVVCCVLYIGCSVDDCQNPGWRWRTELSLTWMKFAGESYFVDQDARRKEFFVVGFLIKCQKGAII